MVSKLINWVLSKTPILKQINGNKVSIGITLIALSLVAKALLVLAVAFPDYAAIFTAAGSGLTAFLDHVQHYGELVGVPLTVVGAMHDKIKDIIAK